MHTCQVCGQTGNRGAMWLVFVEGDENPPKRVHKPCGEAAVANAPEGVTARVVPTRELRMEWQKQKQVRNFWDGKFAEASQEKSRKEAKATGLTV